MTMSATCCQTCQKLNSMNIPQHCPVAIFSQNLLLAAHVTFWFHNLYNVKKKCWVDSGSENIARIAAALLHDSPSVGQLLMFFWFILLKCIINIPNVAKTSKNITTGISQQSCQLTSIYCLFRVSARTIKFGINIRITD